MDSMPLPEPLHAAVEVKAPPEQRVPLVFASPHSGSHYPHDFLAQSALDPEALRRSEDTFVDELFAAARDLGAPMLKALFPRAYLDVNREPYELDPTMFDEPLPHFVNVSSPRVTAGLGTIPRLVATGAEIYKTRLSFQDAQRRIESLYRPYHAALGSIIGETQARFGCCLLIDCHSMPSIGGPTDCDTGASRLDFVLGDCFGTTCAHIIPATADTILSSLGYRVVRNAPYAGGYTTRHYGAPAEGRHTLQIEVNRRLYMNEATHVKRPGFDILQSHLGKVIGALADLAMAGHLRP
jgi:N-formylglutamate amidohydrolase